MCFALALLAEKLGYSTALGAFLAGILVAESGLGKKVEHSTAAVRDVFASVFFVSIGMSVNPELAVKHLPTSLLVLSVVIGLQFVSVLLGGLLSGTGLRRSVAAGLALGQIGEFAFILAQIGRDAYVVGAEMQTILVTVAVASTFTTALLLRFSPHITHIVERALPGRFLRLLNIYESWFDRMRRRPTEKSGAVASVIRAVFIDLLFAALIVGAFRVWQREIELYLYRHFHLGTQLIRTVSSLALGVALLPIFVLLALATRKLSRSLSARVFPGGDSHGRGLLQALLVSSVVVVAGMFGAALLAPVMGAGYVWAGFAVALLFTFALVWRRAGEVDQEITSGGALLMQAIVEQGLPEAERETQAPPVMPTSLKQVALRMGDFAVGQTLAELRLRTLTGASVLACRLGSGEVRSPTGAEALSSGDVLYLAGSEVDQEAAELLPTRGPPEQKPPNELDHESPEPSS